MMRRQIRFSLRLFFFTWFVIAIAIAMWVTRAQRQRSIAEAFLKLGGRVTYAKPFLPVPAKLIQFAGYDYFCCIDGVTLYPTQSAPADEQIRTVIGFPQLRSIAIWPQSTKGNSDPSARENKSYLVLGYNPAPYGVNENDVPGGISEAGLDLLLESLPDLQSLSLISARISPESPIYSKARNRVPFVQINSHTSYR